MRSKRSRGRAVLAERIEIMADPIRFEVFRILDRIVVDGPRQLARVVTFFGAGQAPQMRHPCIVAEVL